MTTEQKELVKQARNAYLRQWRKNNPEKYEAIKERYWLKKAAQYEGERKEGERNDG
ncbi:MAG: phosphatase [Eubacteriales bacterium]|nr:phosphatase [Eubacteriales bacterium]